MKLLTAIWKRLEKKYTKLVAIILILNLQPLALTAHGTEGGEITDIVRKTIFFTALECMGWFINHNCYLNHTGSPQVCFFKFIFLRATHNFWGDGGGRGAVEQSRYFL